MEYYIIQEVKNFFIYTQKDLQGILLCKIKCERVCMTCMTSMKKEDCVLFTYLYK